MCLRNWILSYFILFFCFLLWILKFDLNLIKNPRCGQWWLYSPLSSKPLVFCLDWHRAVLWRPWTTPPVFSHTSVLSWAVPGTSGHWPQAAQALLLYFLSLGGSVTACCLKSPGYCFFSSFSFSLWICFSLLIYWSLEGALLRGPLESSAFTILCSWWGLCCLSLSEPSPGCSLLVPRFFFFPLGSAFPCNLIFSSCWFCPCFRPNGCRQGLLCFCCKLEHFHLGFS